jgi:tRNA uridine 5-carboxymethylaminomethyl modification enzyme
MKKFSRSASGISRPERPALPCYITYTSEKTHEIIRSHLGRSPLFSGRIEGNGPRYCPSIEDKVVKFPERERHHVFVEPEGMETEEMYLNGLSTSLPEDAQAEYIHSVPGLEHAEIMRPGYAVEYDYLNPARSDAGSGIQADAQSVHRRPDQRHQRL